MPRNKLAGSSAYVEKYRSPHRGVFGYVIHCNLCRADDRDWSTRIAARRIYRRNGGRRKDNRIYDQQGRRLEGFADSFEHAMLLWTVHMGVHHPEEPQPDWLPPEDLDSRIEDVEHRFFDVTPEQLMLRAIFGEGQ